MDAHSRPPKLMDRVKAIMRVKRYSPRTVKTYCYWIRYFIRFNGVRHPASMGGPEVKAFLEHLAVDRRVASATQNQALNAVVFLYRHVLDQPLGDIGDFAHARQPRRLPVVLSHEQATSVLNQLSGSMHLMASLMYGSGLRVLETCRLRVRDIDFDRQVLTIRAGKGDKGRTTLLPATCIPALQHQISTAKRISGRYRSCWATRVSKRRRSTPTCWAKALPAYAARWAEARGHSGTLPPLPGHAAMTRCHPCGSPCVLGHSSHLQRPLPYRNQPLHRGQRPRKHE